MTTLPFKTLPNTLLHFVTKHFGTGIDLAFLGLGTYFAQDAVFSGASGLSLIWGLYLVVPVAILARKVAPYAKDALDKVEAWSKIGNERNKVRLAARKAEKAAKKLKGE